MFQQITIEVRKDSNADIMTFEEFQLACQNLLFVNDDGSGYWATTKGVTSFPLRPSDVWRNSPSKDFTHVAWYNK
jgi:hypothetical protein